MQGDGGDSDEAAPLPYTAAAAPRRFREDCVVRCHVQGCTAVMRPGQAGVRCSNLRYRICWEHMREAVLPGSDPPQRWCHKCSRRQPLEDFDGNKRTCERVLRQCSERRYAARREAGLETHARRPRVRVGPTVGGAGGAEAAGEGGSGGGGDDGAGGDGAASSRVRRAAATGIPRAQRLDEEEERYEAQVARPRRRTAAAPRVSAAERDGRGAETPPWPSLPTHHMYLPGAMGAMAAAGLAPGAAAARYGAAAAPAHFGAAPVFGRNAAAGFAAPPPPWASPSLGHFMAAAVAAVAAARAAPPQAGEPAAAASGGRAFGGAAAPLSSPLPPPADVPAHDFLAALMALVAAHGSDAVGRLAAMPPPQPPPPLPPPPPPPLHLPLLPPAAPMPGAAMAQQAMPLALVQLLASAASGSSGTPPAVASAASAALLAHYTGEPGGAHLAALLAALQEQ